MSNDELIKRMVHRFLCWKLPKDFAPDAGISFKAEYNQDTPYPAKHEPIGTNLFTADQAKAMFEYLLCECPFSACRKVGRCLCPKGLKIGARQPAGEPEAWKAALIERMGGHTIAACDLDAWKNFLGLLKIALRDSHPPSLPEGMVMVPVEPTINMARAGSLELPELRDTMGAVVLCKAIYRAMLAAAKEEGK